MSKDTKVTIKLFSICFSANPNLSGSVIQCYPYSSLSEKIWFKAYVRYPTLESHGKWWSKTNWNRLRQTQAILAPKRPDGLLTLVKQSCYTIEISQDYYKHFFLNKCYYYSCIRFSSITTNGRVFSDLSQGFFQIPFFVHFQSFQASRTAQEQIDVSAHACTKLSSSQFISQPTSSYAIT